MKNLAIICMFSLFLSACATPYQPADRQGGYSHYQVNESGYIVTFVGNGLTDKERANDFARLRAAQIGKQLGYKYVAIVGEIDQSSSQIVSLGSHSTTTVTSYGSGATANTTSVPLIAAAYRPATSIGALYFMEVPDKRYLELYDIDLLIPGLKEKYGIE